jgi:DNA replication protein DnaC
MSDLSHINSREAISGGSSHIRRPAGPPPQELFWDCSVCGPIEPLLLYTGHYIKRSCTCQRNVRYAREADRTQKERMHAIQKRTYGWLGRVWEDKSLTTLTFGNYDVNRQAPGEDRRSVQNALERCRQFAEKPSGTILLFGPYGLGKTHLLAAICNRLAERGVYSLFTTTPAFFSAYYSRMHSGESEWDIVEQALVTPFLVFDDFDKAGAKEFRKEVFFQVIDQRVKNGLPMGISTNKMDQLENYIGKESFSRLMVGLQAIKMTGKDCRLSLIGKKQ